MLFLELSPSSFDKWTFNSDKIHPTQIFNLYILDKYSIMYKYCD